MKITRRPYLKPVFRIDRRARLIRLFRVLWSRGEWGQGGYSAKFSVALSDRPFAYRKTTYGRILTVFFLRFHYKRSYGGTIV